MKKIFTRKLKKQFSVVLCLGTSIIAVVMMLYLAQNMKKPVVHERVQLVLVDDTLSTNVSEFISISDEAVLKRIASIKEIEMNTDVRKYSDKILVVSSEHQDLKEVAFDLGYKIVQVN